MGLRKAWSVQQEIFLLAEFKDAIRHEISCIYVDMLHASVDVVLICFQSIISCAGGDVDHLQL